MQRVEGAPVYLNLVPASCGFLPSSQIESGMFPEAEYPICVCYLREFLIFCLKT